MPPPKVDSFIKQRSFQYPNDSPLCGNIKFRPLAKGITEGEQQVRFGVLFLWNDANKLWKAQLSSKEKSVKIGSVEYILYRTPLGVRAYQK